jgi:hypothetical protein
MLHGDMHILAMHERSAGILPTFPAIADDDFSTDFCIIRPFVY